MNVLKAITLKALQKNRTRTVVTIVGIILSAAMFTAVTTFLSSLQHYMVDATVYMDGQWHAAFFNTTPEVWETLQNEDGVEDVAAARQIGYARLEESQNEGKPYLYLAGGDETFFRNMPVHLIVGRLPENDAELLLPAHLKSNGSVDIPLGSVLTLPIGVRESDGYTLSQQNPLNDEEIFSLTGESRQYTVVGFYERPSFEPYSAPGYTALTFVPAQQAHTGLADLYLSLKKPSDAYPFLARINSACNVGDSTANRDLLMYQGISGYRNFRTVLYSLAAILMSLIVLGSVSLIYNAFAISVSERTRQFGLLSSIGATRRQLRKSVFFEALSVGAVGIPVGIGCGILGIGVTLFCVRDAFSAIFNREIPLTLSLHVDLLSVAVAALLSLGTILLSAWIPSRRATRIAPIAAIRQANDITAGRRRIGRYALTRKLLGLEGALARKYFSRDRKKYRSTVISLFLSIVLFISTSAFCSYLKQSVTGVFEPPAYDLSCFFHPEMNGDPAVLFRQLQKVEGITRSNLVAEDYMDTTLPRSLLTESYLTHIYGNGDTEEAVPVSFRLIFVEDSAFRAFLAAEGIPDRPDAAVARRSISSFSPEQGRYLNLDVLHTAGFRVDARSVSAEEENAAFPAFTVTDLSVGAPFGCENGGGSLQIFLPMSAVKNGSNLYYRAFFNADDPDRAERQFTVLMPANTGIDNNASDSEGERSLILLLNVFSYGFITLISLIAAANVFNTISTNLSLRRRDFAMLRSIGMTTRNLYRMLRFECLFYGVKALCYGLPVSFFITWLIYRSVDKGFMTFFFLPWTAVGIAVCSVFAVVFSTMLYAMRKIRQESVITALRSETV